MKNILELANEYTTVDRNSSYGTPENNFQRIADYWNIYFKHKREVFHTEEFNPKDVAMMMTLMKIAREDYFHKMDNLIDGCGYLRCASQIEGDEVCKS